MPIAAVPDFSPALPEILLACGAMALLLLGVFRGEGSNRLVSWLAVALLLAVLVVSSLFGGNIGSVFSACSSPTPSPCS